MPYSQYGDQATKAAAANLRKILVEIAPYVRKPKVEEISTAGTWRSTEPLSIELTLGGSD